MQYAFLVCLLALSLNGCQPSSPSLSFAADQAWQLAITEKASPIEPAVLNFYEEVIPLPRDRAPLSKFIQSADYQVYISILMEGLTDQERQALVEPTRADMVLIDQQIINHEGTSLYQYLWQKSDQRFVINTLYTTPNGQIPVMVSTVTADSAIAHQQLFSASFIEQKLSIQ